MISDAEKQDLVSQIGHLIAQDVLSETDLETAKKAARRLEQPLRILVFGTDPRHAIALTNMMIGQRIMPGGMRDVDAHFVYGDTQRAKVLYRDGRQETLLGDGAFGLFEENPRRVRMALDLPVLAKVSFRLIATMDSIALSGEVANVVTGSDVIIWAGGGCPPDLAELWSKLPEKLHNHSYLVVPPGAEMTGWDGLATKFADLLEVDARRAQEAKTRKSGVDKMAFKDSGGTLVVKAIKKEIDLLVQSAVDACNVLLMRYEAELPPPVEQAAVANEDAPLQLDETAIVQQPEAPAVDEERLRRIREGIYSRPLGKVATRSRGLLYK